MSSSFPFSTLAPDTIAWANAWAPSELGLGLGLGLGLERVRVRES